MITRGLLSVPYEITRTPLVLIDLQLARRLPKDSLPRLVSDRVLGSYDRLAGRLLNDPDLAQRGLDRLTRSGGLAHAQVLDREPAQVRQVAEKAARAERAAGGPPPRSRRLAPRSTD